MYSRLRWAALLPCLVASSIAVGCGSDEVSEVELERARAEARDEAKKEAELRDLKRRIREQEKKDRGRRGGGGGGGGGGSGSGGGGAPPAPAMKSCGSGVYANGNTTCPFAHNVRNEYYNSGQSSVIRVHSPVTGSTYTMSCSSRSPHTCTGGNDASVTFD